VYYVTLNDGEITQYDTRRAEQLVQQLCDDRGIVWKPVPRPGGETELAETQVWIATQQGET
jgi:hypothetical protein